MDQEKEKKTNKSPCGKSFEIEEGGFLIGSNAAMFRQILKKGGSYENYLAHRWLCA